MGRKQSSKAKGSIRAKDRIFCKRLISFLKLSKVGLDKLKGIALIEGGGSFSAVRQAAAVLNTIALVKGLPLAGFDLRQFDSLAELLPNIHLAFKKSIRSSRACRGSLAIVGMPPPRRGQFLKPIYSGEPNINIRNLKLET